MNGNLPAIPQDAAVINEPLISNARGTLAMAKLGNNPNSATKEWFFNLADNSTSLNKVNGGFTVFGRVTNDAGLAVMDRIAALPIPGIIAAFPEIPLMNYRGGIVTEANLVLILSIKTLANPGPVTLSEITSPASLTSSAATFNWTAVSGASQYHLYVGSNGPGSSNLFSLNTGAGTSQAVTGIPTNGMTVSVRLWTLFNGVWGFNDYFYTAASSSLAAMQSPAPDSVLTDSTVTFNWSPGSGTQYHLYVGSNGVGSSNLFSQNTGSATSRIITGLPSNGIALNVRLWSLIAGAWQFNDYTYTAATAGLKAVMQNPTPGTTFPGSAVQFSWSAATGASQYHIYAGSLGVGSNNLFSLNTGTARTQLVTGLPTNGSTIYVRLWSLLQSVWQFNDYAYTAQADSLLAVLQSPVPGSILAGSSVTFQWNNSGASQYHLYAGTSGAGSNNLFSLNTGSATSQSVSNLPTNGSTVYVRLWTLVAGIWQFNDFAYISGS